MTNIKNVFVYSWKTEEIKDSGDWYTELRAFGIDGESNDNVCIRVSDFRPRLVMEVTNTKYFEANIHSIKNVLAEKIYNRVDRSTISVIYRERLYGCGFESDGSRKKYPFIEIKFTSMISLYSFKKKALLIPEAVFGGPIKFHETNVRPEIQFCVEKDIPVCGWIKLRNASNESKHNKVSKCADEYVLIGDQICKSDVVLPVDAKVMAWDIEAKCKDINLDPGNDVSDKVFQISCVFFRTISDYSRKVLLTLGMCDEWGDDTVEIKKYSNEKDLIVAFVDLISEEQPNVMTGWNIFTFDITFMINRAERHRCLDTLTSFGFLLDTEAEVVNVKWSSKAFSTTDIKYIDAAGIVPIDLIEVVRKDYKLDSYSLNNVSKHFLNSEKDDVSFADLMHAYNLYIANDDRHAKLFSDVGKYCVQDSVLVGNLFKHLQTWVALSEMAKTTNTPILAVHVNGQQKKFYNQVYKYCFKNGIVVESDAYSSKETDRYAGAYVFDPVPGLYEYVVPLDFASLYPSIIEAYNLDYTTFVPDSVDIEDESTLTTLEWEDHVCCMHDPIVIQRNALSRTIESLTAGPERSRLSKERAEITKKINKKPMCQRNRFRFLKQEHYGKGVLPTIIENLLEARRTVRKEMKQIKDPALLAIMNQRQLSYKVSANSMYGATGVRSGALPFMPIAMCVTYIGRESIKKASNILKELGGFIVYGDTDSNYVTFDDIKGDHVSRCRDLWDKATEYAAIVSSHFPSPMKIEFEEVIYSKFMILTKKRYMYYKCDRDGNVAKKIGQKGVLLARRDTCKFVKNIYEQTVMDVFNGVSKDGVMNNICDSVLKLMTRQVSEKDLTITKAVNDYNSCELVYNESSGKYMMGNYTVPAPPVSLETEEERIQFCVSRLPAQVQLEIKMIERGEERAEGARLEYIVTDKPGKQSNKIEHWNFFVENRGKYKVDYEYYIQKLVDPLEQIFTSIFKTENYVGREMMFAFKNRKLQVKEIKTLFKPRLVWGK